MAVYPVPATDLVNITNPNNIDNITSVRIAGTEGRTIKTIVPAINNASTTLSVADLPNGVYVLHIATDNSTISRKIVVMR